MAESLNSTRKFVFRESKILVNVDHASEDLFVVSYPFKSKLFQGILIDSTNRYLPCAYPSPDVVKWSPPRVTDVKDASTVGVDPPKDADRAFYSLSNRFTYFQDILFQKNVALVKSAKQAKARAQKMTVRLRPRQVLCSKCRSICNENSENVHSSGSAKKDPKGDKNNKNLLTETVSNENQNVEVKSPRKKVRTTLVPKLSRLEPEDMRALNGNPVEGSRAWSEMLEADKQMVLRKKRSVGSMEDLWDETVFEEAAKKAKTTPIIKISFGSPGEGTVVKIPPKVQLSGSEGEDEEEEKDLTESSKSLKKAMKKAKKEAKRKISPEREEEQSPEEPNYKKHRHRVKHKKRHKNSKEEEMKDKCLKQKLSISLRRVCGPGEEESWSGESSRSSEAIKDTDELKPDSVQEMPSRVVCENAQDFKEASPPPEPIRKTRKGGPQRKKKNTTSGEPSQQESQELLTSEETRHSTETIASTIENQTQSVKVAQTSLNKLQSKTISATYLGDENSTKVLNSLEDPGGIAKDIGASVENTSADKKLDTPCSQVVGSKVCRELDAVLPPQLINMQNISETADKKSNIVDRLEETLDDTLISDDSMPDLDETIEDALLESDKEMPESLENQRDISLSEADDQWDNEPEIPVLTRMVDPEDLNKSNSSLKPVVNILGTSETLSKDITDSKNLKLPSDDVRLKNKDLTGVKKDAMLVGSSSLQSSLTQDDIVDSSGESDFLPAEDSFDCDLPSQIPPTPQVVKVDDPSVFTQDPLHSTNSVDPVDQPSQCVHPSNPNTFKHCLTSKSLFHNKQEDCLDSSASVVEPKQKKRKCEKAESFNTGPTFCDELGCEDNTLKPIEADQLQERATQGRSDIDLKLPQLETSKSSSCKIEFTCKIDVDPSKMERIQSSSSRLDSIDRSLGTNDLNTPNFGPFPCKDTQSDELKDTIPSLSASSDNLSSRSPCKRGELTRLSSICSSPDEGLLDTVPNFPDSSSQGAQEVTSCQAEDGTLLTVGDIVWAKIHGFPWWPAKVVRLSASSSGGSGCDARVAWFGSATSSLMSTDRLSPFIQTFKAKYNRERKSTGYLEAIRQATSEASTREFHLPSPLAEIDELLAL